MKEIKIYQDSGYHYYFFSIFSNKDIEGDDELSEYINDYYKIIDFRENISEEDTDVNDDDYSSIREKFITEIDSKPYIYWKKSINKKYRYLQYRLAKKKIDNIILYGIHICIDSTRGQQEDGLIKKVVTDVKEEKDSTKFETPYFSGDDTSPLEVDLLEAFPDLKESFFNNNYSLKINIITLQNNHELAVTLFVDYGNSRTTACVIDSKIIQLVNKEELETKVRPIILSNDLSNSKVDSLAKDEKVDKNYDIIIDSWFATTKPKLQQDIEIEYLKNNKEENVSLWNKIKNFFSKENSKENIIKKYYLKPFMFCETAPIVMGKEAYNLIATIEQNHATMLYFSSPKRYLWDNNKATGVNQWSLVNIDDVGVSNIVDFNCYYNYFYKKVKDSNNLDNIEELFDRSIFKEKFTDVGMFSNRDTMIFNALKIIETAYLQINSESYREGQTKLKRFISDIIITYPASWTKKEYDEYKLAWEQAKAIFYLSRLSKDSLNNLSSKTTNRSRSRSRSRINNNNNNNLGTNNKETFFNISMDINESVASSIPIVFSEIKQLNEKILTWINLYGKRDNCVRVFSLDIGGGTQDISIIDFFNNSKGQNIKLEYEVNLNESSRDAGDILVKRLLEDILFPYFAKNVTDKKIKDNFINQLNKVQGSAIADMTRSTLTRTVYMPIVLDWLKKLNIDAEDISSSTLTTNINTTNVILDNLKTHNNLFGNSQFNNVIKLDKNSKIEVNRKEVERVINRWIKDLIRDPIILYEAFECDMLIVSGKPSELREVSKVVKKYFPISNNGIVFVKGYRIFPHNGTIWLPFLKNDKIYDAKLSAIIGSLLINSARRKDLFKSWDSIIEKPNKSVKKYYWKFGKDSEKSFIYNPYSDNNTDQTFKFTSLDRNVSIYRFLFKGSRNVQKIYEFTYIGKNDNLDEQYTAIFKINGDELEHIDIEAKNGEYSKKDFILKVNTLDKELYWLDSPRYDNIKI